ncbi:MAG: hypothetical protein CMO81_00655 [Waddliaceae bacterium]|nr:hypothetical protein [Waddliaceae bacterium]
MFPSSDFTSNIDCFNCKQYLNIDGFGGNSDQILYSLYEDGSISLNDLGAITGFCKEFFSRLASLAKEEGGIILVSKDPSERSFLDPILAKWHLPHTLIFTENDVALLLENGYEGTLSSLYCGNTPRSKSISHKELHWPNDWEIKHQELAFFGHDISKSYLGLLACAYMNNESVYVNKSMSSRPSFLQKSFPCLSAPCSFRVTPKGDIWVEPSTKVKLGQGSFAPVWKVWSPTLGIYGAEKTIYATHELSRVQNLADFITVQLYDFCPTFRIQGARESCSMIMEINSDLLSNKEENILNSLTFPGTKFRKLVQLCSAFIDTIASLSDYGLVHTDAHDDNCVVVDKEAGPLIKLIDLESIVDIGELDDGLYGSRELNSIEFLSSSINQIVTNDLKWKATFAHFRSYLKLKKTEDYVEDRIFDCFRKRIAQGEEGSMKWQTLNSVQVHDFMNTAALVREDVKYDSTISQWVFPVYTSRNNFFGKVACLSQKSYESWCQFTEGQRVVLGCKKAPSTINSLCLESTIRESTSLPWIENPQMMDEYKCLMPMKERAQSLRKFIDKDLNKSEWNLLRNSLSEFERKCDRLGLFYVLSMDNLRVTKKFRKFIIKVIDPAKVLTENDKLHDFRKKNWVKSEYVKCINTFESDPELDSESDDEFDFE